MSDILSAEEFQRFVNRSKRSTRFRMHRWEVRDLCGMNTVRSDLPSSEMIVSYTDLHESQLGTIHRCGGRVSPSCLRLRIFLRMQMITELRGETPQINCDEWLFLSTIVRSIIIPGSFAKSSDHFRTNRPPSRRRRSPYRKYACARFKFSKFKSISTLKRSHFSYFLCSHASPWAHLIHSISRIPGLIYRIAPSLLYYMYVCMYVLTFSLLRNRDSSGSSSSLVSRACSIGRE